MKKKFILCGLGLCVVVVGIVFGIWKWYVTENRCAVEECTNWKGTDSVYCTKHLDWEQCGDYDCTAKRLAEGKFCTEHTCTMEGCYLYRNDTSDQGYCKDHAAAYAEEQGYSVCMKSRCYRPQSDGEFCEEHIGTCKNYHCPLKAEDGSDYCSYHDPNKDTTSTTTSTTTKKTTTTTTKKSSASSSGKKSSSKKSDPYGAKSYENAEDFYEDHYDDFFDYDDAESYWEDHD
jgi:hypothetical protein